VSNFVLPEFLFVLVRSPCKSSSVVLNSSGKKKNKKSGKIPKIVATFVYASSQGQRTHSA
jgi:hypothetical protein